MNYFSKIRLGTWIVIILTTINLATLGTIFYKHLNERASGERMPHQGDQENKGFRYFMHELNLTPEQEKFFCDSRKVFFDSAKHLFQAQETLRIQMIKELSTANPDTAALYRISEEMANNYFLLKKQTIKHLLKFREICSPEQRKKLDTIYHKLIRPEGPMGRQRHKRKVVIKDLPERPEEKP